MPEMTPEYRKQIAEMLARPYPTVAAETSVSALLAAGRALWDELVQCETQLAEAREGLTVAAQLIDRLSFDDECDYDHHDYCQAHNLHARPCPHPLGRQYVEAWCAVEAEQQPEDGDRG